MVSVISTLYPSHKLNVNVIALVKGEQFTMGNNSTADLKEINTQSKGRCFIWTPKFKVKNLVPAIWIHLKAPKNKFVQKSLKTLHVFCKNEYN